MLQCLMSLFVNDSRATYLLSTIQNVVKVASLDVYLGTARWMKVSPKNVGNTVGRTPVESMYPTEIMAPTSWEG